MRGWWIHRPSAPASARTAGRPIIVRRTDGRTVYLTEAAVEVFEAERQREADMATWTTQRAQWLRLARGVGAPEDRRGRIAARPVSAESVADARALYLAAAAKDRKEAARMGAWDIAARIGREEAMALYREAGSPVPVPADIWPRSTRPRWRPCSGR